MQYKKLLFSTFILISPLLAHSDELAKSREKIRAQSFTPHITAESLTRKKGKVSLQRAVGANLNTSVFLSSLNYAVTDRFEIGTSVIHYFNTLHRGNMSFKYTFWRSPHFVWSFGGNSANFKLDEAELPPEFQNKDIGVSITSVQLLLNYFPSWTDLRFGFNFNSINTHLNNVDQETEDLSLSVKYEFGMDINKSLNSDYDITFGLGWLRTAGVSALEEVEFGFGTSFRWYRQDKFLSSPTIGVHYTPETEDVEFLFSTSFY